MTQLPYEHPNQHLEIDRMINEGLGGGFILYDYDRDRLTIQEDDSLRIDTDQPRTPQE